MNANEIKHQSFTLNTTDGLPAELFDHLMDAYSKIEGWRGTGDGNNGELGIPYWFSSDENQPHMTVSYEPSGLQFSGLMTDEGLEPWKSDVIQKIFEITGVSLFEF